MDLVVSELRAKADEFKKKEDHISALPLYRAIWEKEKNEWNGYYLALCLRKTEHYIEARDIQNIVKSINPNFKPIQNEELWLDYNEKIKNWNNESLLDDANLLLSKTNQYDNYTGNVFCKTVLSVVKYLMYDNDNGNALLWLDKLDFSILSNSPCSFKGQQYASDQKAYFVRYADVLVKLGKHIQYIENYLSAIKIEGVKQIQFKKYIIETITYEDYNGNKHITRLRLGLYLKYLKEEIRNRELNQFTKIYNPNKITTISNLGDFIFCPVSYAINETFLVPPNTTWEKDEWLGEKKHLLDYYNEFQKNQNYIETFKDTLIEISDIVKMDFNEIFTSTLVSNNYDESSKTYYSNKEDTVRGNPNYVFESKDGIRFVVIEKFTKRTQEGIQAAYDNDLIKLYGYLFELESLRIEFGYIIYWYWQLEDVQVNNNIKKLIRVKTYRIFKIDKTSNKQNTWSLALDNIEGFKFTGSYEIDGDRISYPNKCLNCSVVSYCNHKTGKFNSINLPYDISPLTSRQTDISTSNDDLPF